jgi:DNA-binding winged helix-turn-helix (wHTH) protein/TolB-like protein
MERPEYRVRRFTLQPFRQLLYDGVPVAIGRKALGLLSVLARAEGALVTKDELMAAVWPDTIVEENAIQVHIAAARKVLGADADLLSTSHGLGYRLAVTDGPGVLEAPETKPPAEAAVAPGAAPAARRWPTRALAADLIALLLAVVLAAGGGAWLKQAIGGRGGAPKPPTIAVLAFQPAAGDESARLYANGLARSLASTLSQYDVTVISPSSSLQLTAAQKSRARALLGADFVIDGRIIADGPKLTVSTQVSDTRKNVIVYSFDVANDSVLSKDLAARIATHLALTLDPSRFLGNPAHDFTAADYALIARANEGIDGGDMLAVADASRRLAERYPDDGEFQATAGVPMIYAMPDMPESQRAQAARTARAYIDRGTQLAPRSGIVNFARSQLTQGPMNLVRQERLLRDAMVFNPAYAPTFNAIGEAMLDVGRTDEGVALLHRSVQLDPLSNLVNDAAAAGYIVAGRRDDALEAMARDATLWPDPSWDRMMKFEIASYLGTPGDVIAVEKIYPTRVKNLGVSQADADLMPRAEISGDKALIAKSIADCFTSYGRTRGPYWDHTCLYMMVRTGNLDDAFRVAERAFPDNRGLYPPNADRWLTAPPSGLQPRDLFLPVMAPFRNDPRFWRVALRTGLVNYWRTTNQWPDFCRAQIGVCKARAAGAMRTNPAV